MLFLCSWRRAITCICLLLIVQTITAYLLKYSMLTESLIHDKGSMERNLFLRRRSYKAKDRRPVGVGQEAERGGKR